MVKTLSVLLTGVLIGLVSSCGVEAYGGSTAPSGPVMMARIDGHTLYKLCDTQTNRLVYFTSTGGVAVANTGSC